MAEQSELRGPSETVRQHADATVEVQRAMEGRGWSVTVMPEASPLTMRVGTTSVVLRDERRQSGERLCVEYEQNGRPAGVFKSGESVIWIHLVSQGAAAFPGWWMRDEVTWRREYRSTWDARVGDSGGRAVLVPILSLLMRPGAPFRMAYGEPCVAAAEAFESVVPSRDRKRGAAC